MNLEGVEWLKPRMPFPFNPSGHQRNSVARTCTITLACRKIEPFTLLNRYG